ncbi:MAG: thioredoxin family protein [Ignavibacterium sp.]|nr:thioredoxin family protein [Ignavibacterium sp.]MDW8375355.1 thioredoxin family protein [Ignavibacteriales bacterium]
MDKKELLKNKINSALSYSEYQKYAEDIVYSLKDKELNEEEKFLYEYRKLNLARVSRVEKTYSPSERIKTLIESIQSKQIWLVITEDWCGDSAQNLPAIAKIASLNEKIDLKIVLRDQNLDLMDLYLTDGKRSIPKLIGLNENYEELFIWGSRPKNAQDFFDELKNKGFEKEYIIKEIHSWYAKDRCQSLESEFVEILTNLKNY